MTYKSYRQLPGALWLRGLLPVSAGAAPGKLPLLLSAPALADEPSLRR